MPQKYELYRLRGIIERIELECTHLTVPAYDSRGIRQVKENLEDIANDLDDILDDFVDINRGESTVLEELNNPKPGPVRVQVDTETCEHEKVYASYILASNPPQTPWICRKCHKQGRDVLGPISGSTEYADLLHEIIANTLYSKEDK